MNPSGAYQKRATTLRKIKRLESRLLKFDKALHEILDAIVQIKEFNYDDSKIKTKVSKRVRSKKED